MAMPNYSRDVEGLLGERIEIVASDPPNLVGEGAPGVAQRHVALKIEHPDITGTITIALAGQVADALAVHVVKASGCLEIF
jgi:hypothetical protein